MVMSLSECNLTHPTRSQVDACLQDCKINFSKQFSEDLSSLFALNGETDAAKLKAHNTCNTWRKNAEVLDVASEPSNLILIATVSIIVLIVAAKLLTPKAQQQQAKPAQAPAKPIIETTHKAQPTTKFSLFGISIKV